MARLGSTSFPRMITALQSEVLALRQITEQQKEEIRILKERQFGRKSEKFSEEDINQGKLFNEAEMLSTSPEARRRRRPYTSSRRSIREGSGD